MSRAELLKVIILNDISSSSSDNKDVQQYQRKMISLLNMEKTELRDYIKSNNIDMDIISKLVSDNNTNIEVNEDKIPPILDTPKFTPPPKFPNTSIDILFRFNEYDKEYFKSNLTDERIVILFSGVCDSKIHHSTPKNSETSDLVVSNIISFLEILGEEYIKKYTDFILINRVDERLNVLEPYNEILIHFGQGRVDISVDDLLYGKISIDDIDEKMKLELSKKLLEVDLKTIDLIENPQVVPNIIEFLKKVNQDVLFVVVKNMVSKNVNSRFEVLEPYRTIATHFSPSIIKQKQQ